MTISAIKDLFRYWRQFVQEMPTTCTAKHIVKLHVALDELRMANFRLENKNAALEVENSVLKAKVQP